MKISFVFILQIILIVIIPLLMIGSDFFKHTPFYDSILGFSGVEKSIYYKLSTQYSAEEDAIISIKDDEEEFNNLWRIIKSYTEEDLPEGTPYHIGRFAIKDGAYVNIPDKDGSRKLILIPDTVPIVAVFCPYISGCGNGKIVGTLNDLRRWTEDKRDIKINRIKFIITIISIFSGFCLFYYKDYKIKNLI